jgi:aminotransferase
MISVFGSKVGQEELDEIKSSIENQWLGIGPKVKQFEQEFAKRNGMKDFVLLDSGSNALLMALRVLNLKPGGEVILPAFTWISCAAAVVLAGLKPVFCDVEIESQNVSVETIEPHITENTEAIMIVHYAGKPVDVLKIKEFSGLPIIEDTAHAVDSKIDGRYCGTLGNIGVFSFDAVKNLVMGEGGGITAKRIEHTDLARKLRYCGIGKSGFEASDNKNRWWKYDVIDFFVKMMPDDLRASVGLAQLRKLDELQSCRKKIWNIYQEQFKDIGWFDMPLDPDKNEQHSYFTYFIRLNNDKRDSLAAYLYDRGIYTTLRYQPLHLIPIYGSSTKLKNSEILNEIGLNIPIHPNLSEKDVEYVIDSIKSFGKNL